MDLIVDNGKPVEPGKSKKIISTLRGDNKMTMVFSHGDIQQMLINKIYHETPWLSNYRIASMKHNLADNTYTLEWTKAE